MHVTHFIININTTFVVIVISSSRSLPLTSEEVMLRGSLSVSLWT